ncbi:MAG: hypothetical protein U1F36_03005 [Planctomycetota bacterium]
MKLAAVQVTFALRDGAQRAVLEESQRLRFENTVLTDLVAVFRRRFPMFRFVDSAEGGAFVLECALGPQGPFPEGPIERPLLAVHMHFRCRLPDGAVLSTSCEFRPGDSLELEKLEAELTAETRAFVGVKADGTVLLSDGDVNGRYEQILHGIITRIPVSLPSQPAHVVTTPLVTTGSLRRDFGCSIPEDTCFDIDALVPEPGMDPQRRRFRARVLSFAEIVTRTDDAVLRKSLMTAVEAPAGEGTNETHVRDLRTVTSAATVERIVHIDTLGPVERRCLEFRPLEFDLGPGEDDAAELAVRAALAAIESAVDAGRFEEARQRVATADADTGNSVRARVTARFTKAWTNMRAGIWERDPASTAAAFDSARAGYAAVLEEFPRQPQTLVNLALVLEHLGAVAEASALLSAAVAAGATEPSVHLALADLERAQGHLDMALHVLTVMTEADQQNRAAQERIAVIAREGGSERAVASLEQARTMAAHGQVDLAESVYLGLVETCRTQRAEIAEQALFEWSALKVETGQFDASTLDQLPTTEQWSDQKLAALRALATTTDDASEWLAAFGDDARSRQVAAGILATRSESELVAGHSRRSFDLARTAWSVAPALAEYGSGAALQGQSPVGVVASSVAARSVLARPGSFGRDDLDSLTSAYPRSMFAEMAKFEPERAQRSLQSIGAAIALHGDGEVGRAYLEDVLDLEARNSKRSGLPPRVLPNIHAVTADSFARDGREQESARAHLDAAQGFLLNMDSNRARTQLDRVDRSRLEDAQLRQDFNRLEDAIRLDHDLPRITPSEAAKRLSDMAREQGSEPGRTPPDRSAGAFGPSDPSAEILGIHAERIRRRAQEIGDRAALDRIDEVLKDVHVDLHELHGRLERGTTVRRTPR